MKLNEYSEQFYRNLLQRLPDLEKYASRNEDGSLTIVYPNPGTPASLYISTREDDILIGFRQWHTHGDLLGGEDEDSQIAQSIDFIERIVTDQEKIVVCYTDGEFSDAWVTDDEEGEYEYKQPNEEFEIGLWSQLGTH
jgi:hypothetical protein